MPDSPTIAGYHRVDIRASDGTCLAAWKNIPPAAAPEIHLVFVPGWCMPASIWRYQMRFFSGRFAVTALDPRGQGESGVAREGYNIEQRSRDIASCLKPLSKVVLVGWSLGALEAANYLRDQGEERIAGVVLVDSSVGENPPPATGSAFREALRSNRRAAMREFVRGMFKSARSDAEIEDLTQAALRIPLEESLALFPTHLPREYWREIIRGLSAPLMYMVTPQFAAQAGNLKSARPATRVELFDTAGHALFVDEARRFNRILREFTNELAPRAN